MFKLSKNYLKIQNLMIKLYIYFEFSSFYSMNAVQRFVGFSTLQDLIHRLGTVDTDCVAPHLVICPIVTGQVARFLLIEGVRCSDANQ